MKDGEQVYQETRIDIGDLADYPGAFKRAMDAMDARDLLALWETLEDCQQALEERIKALVMERQKTVRVDFARATYYKPRVQYDFEETAREAGASQEVIDRFTTEEIKKKTDWKAVCLALKVKPPKRVLPARVIVKWGGGK